MASEETHIESVARPRTTFDEVLDAIESSPAAQVEGGNRTRGTAFELASKYFLEHDPAWKTQIQHVWMWADSHNPLNPPTRRRQDVGIDLIALGTDDHYWAIQCKYYDDERTLGQSDISNFFTAAHALKDEQGQPAISDGHYIIFSTGDGYTANLTAAAESYNTAYISLEDLQSETVDWSEFLDRPQNPKYEPRPHQVGAIEDCIDGFATSDRGKLIMACGTGKTLTSLRLAEQLKANRDAASPDKSGLPFRVLFLAPSIALVSQTFRSWVSQAKEDISSFIVCSDETANRKEEIDSLASTRLDIPFPTTTNAVQLLNNVQASERVLYKRQASQTNGTKADQDQSPLEVIFSTYQSIQVTIDAQRHGLSGFDLVVCDEAHRTAGAAKSGEESAFQLVHDADLLHAAKRLYMTATPRIFSSKAAEDARRQDILAYSMDDEDIFGPEFHRLSFGQSVKQGILTDYKVLVLGVNEGQANVLGATLLESSSGMKDKRQAIEKSKFKVKTDTKARNLEEQQKKLEEQAQSFAGKIVGTWNGLLTSGVHLNSQDIDTGLGDQVQVHLLQNEELTQLSPLGNQPQLRPDPLKRAIAFTSRIADSKAVAEGFEDVISRYRATAGGKDAVSTEGDLQVEVRHVDGSMPASARYELLSWLADEGQPGESRVLSNAKCLTEGVDLPSLDAVVFFQPRNSIVDIVQAVGRVMRKSEGKQYGYIILPVIVPTGADDETVLSSSDFKTVWDTIKALRAHDERLDAEINALSLGKKAEREKLKHKNNRTHNRDFRGQSEGNEAGFGDQSNPTGKQTQDITAVQDSLGFNETISEGFQARLVKECGNSAYWDEWAKSIASIASKTQGIINNILDVQTTGILPAEGTTQEASDERIRALFQDFHQELCKTLNPNVTEHEARGMIAQHLLTEPIFEALFVGQKDRAGRSFAQLNPVSLALKPLSDELRPRIEQIDSKRELARFYSNVRTAAATVRNNEDARQMLVKDLYEAFFKNAFKSDSDRLGIVYTPTEVVKFIISSVDILLKQHFSKSLGDLGVSILDPFTGTGTFIVELLRSNLISPVDLEDKYRHEIFANEIMLLAYYIAMVNIESAYHQQAEAGADVSGVTLPISYTPFEGGILTDTFQMSEGAGWRDASAFQANNARIQRENDAEITVIIGNPPYSAGQNSANDNNANLSYPKVDSAIRDRYVVSSTASNSRQMYDSYIRAFRWASDRLVENPNGGVIGFVTGGGWIDNTAFNGFRKSLVDEFSDVYVLNLLGNKEFRRLSREELDRQGDNIFGSGSKSPIAITFLVRDPARLGHGTVHYYDIGDYLSREAKLDQLADWVADGELPAYRQLQPDPHGDWINQRDDSFYTFAPMGLGKLKAPMGLFATYSLGLATGRDNFSYQFSREQLTHQMSKLLDTYASEQRRFAESGLVEQSSKFEDTVKSVQDFVVKDDRQIKWNRSLYQWLARQERILFSGRYFVESLYRPFSKQWLYYDSHLIEMMYRNATLFPLELVSSAAANSSNPNDVQECERMYRNAVIKASSLPFVNRVILTPGKSNQGAAYLISQTLTDLNAMNAGAQCFPLYWYEKVEETPDGELDLGGSPTLKPGDLMVEAVDGTHFIRHDAITDETLTVFQTAYPEEPLLQTTEGNEAIHRAKEAIFYYVYGILNSSEYQSRYATTLRKELPRIPLAKNFDAFEQVGRQLAELHIDYEQCQPYETIIEDWSNDSHQLGTVTKIRYGKTAKSPDNPKGEDRTVLVLNENLTLRGIPEQAYDYKVSGRSPLEWLLDQYQVKTDKASGNLSDPNAWGIEHGNPNYIPGLIKSLVTLSLETQRLIASLPPLNELPHPALWPNGWKYLDR